MPIWADVAGTKEPICARIAYQRVLAQEGRLAAHVRAGQQPDRPVPVAGPRRQIAMIGDEGAARLPPQRLLDHRMAPALDGKHLRAVDLRAAIGLLLGEKRQACGDVDDRERPGARLDRLGFRNDGRRHPVEGFEFDRQRLVGGIGDAAFEIGKFGRGEAHGVRHRLAVDEAGLRVRRLRHRRGIAGGDFDEIAEDVVVLDLQRPDAGLLGILQLQAGDDATRLVAQCPDLVELGVGAVAQEAAIAFQQRQFVGERFGKQLFQLPREGPAARIAPGRALRAASPCRASPQLRPPRRGPGGSPRDRAGRRGRAPGATGRAACRAHVSACRADCRKAAVRRSGSRSNQAAH